MAHFGKEPRTRATAGSEEPIFTEDPDLSLRKARRESRAAKLKEQNLLHDQSDKNKEGELEVPDSVSGEPLLANCEDIGYQYLHGRSAEPENSDTESSSSGGEDPLETVYRNIGYLSPLDESTLQLLEQVLSDPDMDKTGGRISPSDRENFRVGLDERNVSLEPSHDPYFEELRSLNPEAEKETPLERKRQIRAWQLDLVKTQNDTQEPVFQRTIMMSMIDRHRFLYAHGDTSQPVLDFAVERVWKCPPMPSRVLLDRQPKCLTRPKADLALAFRQYAIFQRENWQELPIALRKLLCYDEQGTGTGREVRVFHFMTIEGKNSLTHPDDEVALTQNLNNASQSLDNMYEFFREAGDESTFFDKVRFFSAVSTCKGIKIRVHRACRIGTNPEGEQPDDIPRMRRIVEDYPLQFVFDEFFEASAPDFTRENVVDIFKKIMVGYAIGELLGHLKNAARVVESKFLKHRENHGTRLWRDVGDYLHGLRLPPATRNNSTASLPGQVSAEVTHPRVAELGTGSQMLNAMSQEPIQASGSSPVEPITSQVLASLNSRTRKRPRTK